MVDDFENKRDRSMFHLLIVASRGMIKRRYHLFSYGMTGNNGMISVMQCAAEFQFPLVLKKKTSSPFS